MMNQQACDACPDRESWVRYLYQDATDDHLQQCDEHLKRCERCRRQVARWRQTLGHLDTWKVSVASAPNGSADYRRWITWGLAASLLVVIGFAVGTWNQSSSMAKGIQKQIDESVERAVHDRMAQWLNDQWETLRAERTQQLAAVQQRMLSETDRRTRESIRLELNAMHRAWSIRQVQLQEAMDRLAQRQALTRRDLSTLAVNAEQEIARAHTGIDRLALYLESSGRGGSSP